MITVPVAVRVEMGLPGGKQKSRITDFRPDYYGSYPGLGHTIIRRTQFARDHLESDFPGRLNDFCMLDSAKKVGDILNDKEL